MLGLFGSSPRPDPRDRVEPTIGNVVQGETVSSSSLRMFEIFGNPTTASGAVVTPDSAMRVSAVFSCVSLIAGAISQLPVHVYERTEESRKRADHDYWWLLNEQMSSAWPTAAAWEYLVA